MAAGSEASSKLPALLALNRLEDVEVGMRVEAMDRYGKWYEYNVFVYKASPV